MQNKKILIVEDDQFLANLASGKLESEGFNIELAMDGESAMQKVAETKPDLIILDILLPGINGFDVLQKLKKNPEHKNIPVILLTNLGKAEDIEQGRRLGAADYLIKSQYTLDEIVNRVKKVFARKTA